MIIVIQQLTTEESMIQKHHFLPFMGIKHGMGRPPNLAKVTWSALSLYYRNHKENLVKWIKSSERMRLCLYWNNFHFHRCFIVNSLFLTFDHQNRRRVIEFRFLVLISEGVSTISTISICGITTLIFGMFSTNLQR